MAAQTLTPKQEAFAQAYVETGNASEAYRRAYNTANSKPSSINVNASKLLDDAKIAQRVTALRQAILERHEFTIVNMVSQLDEDRTFARECEAPAPAVTASMGKAKLLGFLTDKIETTIIFSEQAAKWLGR